MTTLIGAEGKKRGYVGISSTGAVVRDLRPPLLGEDSTSTPLLERVNIVNKVERKEAAVYSRRLRGYRGMA